MNFVAVDMVLNANYRFAIYNFDFVDNLSDKN